MFFETIINNLLLFALHLDTTSIFPEPLSPSEEKKYIERMKQGDKKAREVLIERNLRLVAHIIKKYYQTNTETDELISVGTVGLIKAINTYDPSKGVKLATYTSRCIDNEILMFFRGQKKTALDISFDEPIETDSEGNPLTLMDIIATDDTVLEEICLKTNTSKLIKFVNEIENKREREIIIMRYGLDGRAPRTQNEIAKMYNISRSYVSRIETKCLKKLRKKFETQID